MPVINKVNYSSSVSISKKTMGKECAMKSLWFTDNETKSQIKHAGYLGALLMSFYKAIAMQEAPDMEDNTIAVKHLGCSVNAVRKARLNLTKGKWFLRVLDKRNSNRHITYYVGRRAVKTFENGVSAVSLPKIP